MTGHGLISVVWSRDLSSSEVIATFKMIPSKVSCVNLEIFQQESVSMNFVTLPHSCLIHPLIFPPLLAAIMATTYLMDATKYSTKCIC